MLCIHVNSDLDLWPWLVTLTCNHNVWPWTVTKNNVFLFSKSKTMQLYIGGVELKLLNAKRFFFIPCHTDLDILPNGHKNNLSGPYVQ